MTLHRVLVVEDDDTTAAFVCQQLAEGGLAPEAVRGGLEALRKAHAQSFALAIVDVDIATEPDGAETADWLRRLYGVPVVVFSMRGDGETRHQAAVAGQTARLVAPEAFGELSGVVSRVLSAVLSRQAWDEFVGNVYGAGVQRPRVEPSGNLVSDRARPVSEESAGGIAMPQGFAELSGREWQIIRDLIDTPSAHAVALKRQRSRHTVHNHLKSIFRKLQVHSVAELLSLMIRLNRQVSIL